MSFPIEKNTLRKQILNLRNAITKDDKIAYETAALHRLKRNPLYHDAQVIMVYMDFRNEAPTRRIIEDILESGKKLVLPFTDEAFQIIPYEVPALDVEMYLKRSPFGVLEPNPLLCQEIDPKSIDFILVPGVAFDRAGHRLGYGKGCYDGFLPKLRPNAVKLGMAYEFQTLDFIPTEPFDWRVDGLL